MSSWICQHAFSVVESNLRHALHLDCIRTVVDVIGKCPTSVGSYFLLTKNKFVTCENARIVGIMIIRRCRLEGSKVLFLQKADFFYPTIHVNKASILLWDREMKY